MADARDLKSLIPQGVCGFESRHRQLPWAIYIHIEDNKSPFSSKMNDMKKILDDTEGVGFEPTKVVLTFPVFKTGAFSHSAIPPRLSGTF